MKRFRREGPGGGGGGGNAMNQEGQKLNLTKGEKRVRKPTASKCKIRGIEIHLHLHRPDIAMWRDEN